MNPAETLQAAADKLRALATAASTDPDGIPTANWHTKPRWPNDDDGSRYLFGDHRTRDDGHVYSWPILNRGGSPQRPSYMRSQHAEYAAAMGPGVGLALADWLEATAADVARAEEQYRDRLAGESMAPHALAVARQILGGGQP